MNVTSIIVLISVTSILVGLVLLIRQRRRRLAWERRAAEERRRIEAEYQERLNAEQRAALDRELEEERRRIEAEYQERLDAEQRAALDRELEREPVRFHALWHRSIQVEEWKPLLVYMYSGWRGLEGARTDFQRRMTASFEQYGNSMAAAAVQRGAEITILPELTGFMFNPPSAKILWLEEWHCIEFRMQTLRELRSQEVDRVSGRVAFFVGPLLIAETELTVEVLASIPDSEVGTRSSQAHSYSSDFLSEISSFVYRTIFVSYSHRDSAIVQQLERAYRAIGDSYLRDVNILRSGEEWNHALLSKIPSADVFQLCWSHAAKQSPYVEQEWRYAVRVKRPNFIRPMYWEKPMPEPPAELDHIHFTFVDMAL
jgi:TIR domain